MRPASAGPIPRRTFDWPTLIANKDKEIARLEGSLHLQSSKSPASRIVKSRAPCSRMPTRFVSATAKRSARNTS